jgi:hypothetical protein
MSYNAIILGFLTFTYLCIIYYLISVAVEFNGTVDFIAVHVTVKPCIRPGNWKRECWHLSSSEWKKHTNMTSEGLKACLVEPAKIVLGWWGTYRKIKVTCWWMPTFQTSVMKKRNFEILTGGLTGCSSDCRRQHTYRHPGKPTEQHQGPAVSLKWSYIRSSVQRIEMKMKLKFVRHSKETAKMSNLLWAICWYSQGHGWCNLYRDEKNIFDIWWSYFEESMNEENPGDHWSSQKLWKNQKKQLLLAFWLDVVTWLFIMYNDSYIREVCQKDMKEGQVVTMYIAFECGYYKHIMLLETSLKFYYSMTEKTHYRRSTDSFKPVWVHWGERYNWWNFHLVTGTGKDTGGVCARDWTIVALEKAIDRV